MTRTKTMFASLMLMACGSGPQVKKVDAVTAAPPVMAEPIACIGSGAESFEDASLDGDAFHFCTSDGGTDEGCWSYDLASSKLVRGGARPVAIEGDREPPDVMVGERFKYTRSKNTFEVCATADACKVVKVPAKTTLRTESEPSVSADGTMLVATFAPADEGGRPTIVVWDIAKAKELGKQVVGDESYTCGGAEFVGNTVLVALDVCAGPGGLAWLAKPKGLKKIAELGPENFGQYGPTFVALDGDRYVFLEQGGRSLVVQDVVTGKVASRVDLEREFLPVEGSEEPAWDVPAYGSELWKRPNGQLLVALDGRAGKLVLVDAQATKVTQTYVVPRCPPPME